ncbi:MAG TPA: SusC/RagA family TonB-linked outer membrane protein, partial [Bacteroides reticulotermitis]|nr:SusC/RagA family TonB-linked outer membrane protein [Bacteroides reticulotermitis]
MSDVNLPLSSGFQNYKSNVGKIQNRGVELYVNGTIIRNIEKDFRWRMGVKMIHNKNTVKSISNSLQAMNDDLLSTTKDDYNPSFLYKEGESINTIYAVRSKGIDPGSGKEIYIKQDGTETFTWDAKDQVACGVASPKLEGTVNAYVYWKGISLNAIFGYRWGGYAYNATLANKVENIFPYNNADKRVLYDRWKQPGDVVAYKSVTDFSKTY